MLSNKIDWMVAFYFVLKEPAFKRDDILVLVTCNTQSIVFYKLVLDDEVSITPMNCLECCGKWCRMIAITVLPHQLILTECNTSACLSVCGYEIGIVHTKLFQKKKNETPWENARVKGMKCLHFCRTTLLWCGLQNIACTSCVSHSSCMSVCVHLYFFLLLCLHLKKSRDEDK